jgi:hypothetical protein
MVYAKNIREIVFLLPMRINLRCVKMKIEYSEEEKKIINMMVEEVKKWKREVLEFVKREYRELYPFFDYSYKLLETDLDEWAKLQICYNAWLIIKKIQERKSSLKEEAT